MIDSHCHLADPAFAGDLEPVVNRARAAGVDRALCILSVDDRDESTAAARVRSLWPEVQFATGIHPQRAGAFADREAEVASVVGAAADHEHASAIGEIGLDYHYDLAPRDLQQRVFAAQLAVALDRRLPVVIHTRDATEDTFRILAEAGPAVRGVFHCFTGDRTMARAAIEIGFYVSLAGIVTFPKAAELREVARFVPADRLLIETDAPYLAPVPHRGKRNEPGFVPRIAAVVADARGETVPAVAQAVVRNFHRLFGPTGSLQTA